MPTNTVYVSPILGISTVSGKSSKTRIVLAATTILYVANVIEGFVARSNIPLLIGASGKSISQGFSEEFNSFNGADGVFIKILTFSPFIVADGLLVRSLRHALKFNLYFIDMAML